MMQEKINQWAENVSKAYDVLAFGNTERALEILGKTRNEMRLFIAQKQQCKYGQNIKICTSSPMDCQCVIDSALN